jgi:hypothetical protein
MKTHLPQLIVILSVMFSVSSFAQTATLPSPAPNGCGSSWNTYLVPDSIPILGCDFKDACNQHDTCYARCLPNTPTALLPECTYLKCEQNGELNGQAQCNTEPFNTLRAQAAQRKKSCDLNFYSTLGAKNFSNLVCHAFSSLYYKAVDRFGGGSFFGAAPTIASLDVVPNFNRAVIADFLKNASPAELKRVEEDLKMTTPSLDLSKPLTFSADKGLRQAPQ